MQMLEISVTGEEPIVTKPQPKPLEPTPTEKSKASKDISFSATEALGYYAKQVKRGEWGVFHIDRAPALVTVKKERQAITLALSMNRKAMRAYLEEQVEIASSEVLFDMQRENESTYIMKAVEKALNGFEFFVVSVMDDEEFDEEGKLVRFTKKVN